MGPAIIRTIAVEEQFPAAAKSSRKVVWNIENGAPGYSNLTFQTQGAVGYERKLTAFITATEIYL
ncbi:MAG: hypothetical protein IPJ40_12080 [Saprospirales bacterium]|nr:hypothetical protein [Saprospirales bacterium]